MKRLLLVIVLFLALCGIAAAETVTVETAREIRMADAVFGADRLLEGLAAKQQKETK